MFTVVEVLFGGTLTVAVPLALPADARTVLMCSTPVKEAE